MSSGSFVTIAQILQADLHDLRCTFPFFDSQNHGDKLESFIQEDLDCCKFDTHTKKGSRRAHGLSDPKMRLGMQVDLVTSQTNC